jgi:hypothetical protein
MFVVYTHPPNFTPHRVFWPVVHLRVSGPENAIVDAFLVVGSPRETAPASSRGVFHYMGVEAAKKKGKGDYTVLCSP